MSSNEPSAEQPVVRAAVAPAERIVLTDLVLRRWTREDAPALLAAVTESFEHLHPWMPWAAERPTLAGYHETVDDMTRRWESAETFAYSVLDPSQQTLLGSVALHNRIGPDGLEIGYWVHVDHVGRGIATTCAAAITRYVLSLPGIRRVEIHCDEANTASAAVPRRLGYRLDRIQDHEPEAPAESGKRMVWVMTADTFTGSEAELRSRTAHRAGNGAVGS